MSDTLPDDELKWESTKVVDGGSTLSVTHIPTGVTVINCSDEMPLLDRLGPIREKLEWMVSELRSRRASPPSERK